MNWTSGFDQRQAEAKKRYNWDGYGEDNCKSPARIIQPEFDEKLHYFKEHQNLTPKLVCSNSAEEEQEKDGNWIIDAIALDLVLARDPGSWAGLVATRQGVLSIC